MTTAALGAEVLVLEKGPSVGGIPAPSTGELWVAGSHPEAQAGIRDSWSAGARATSRAAPRGCAVPADPGPPTGCYFHSGAANTRGMMFGSLAARHALGLEAPEDC